MPAQSVRTRPLSLRKNFSWTMAGNMVYALSVFGVVFLIESLSGLEMLGQYVLANTFCIPIFLLSNLELRTILVTDAENKYRFQDFVTLRTLTIPASLLLLGLISWGGDYSSPEISIILAMGFARALESASELCYASCQKRERMDLVSRSLMLKGISLLGSMGLGILLTQNLLIAICLCLVCWFGLFLFHDLRNVQKLIQNDTGETLIQLLTPHWNGKICKSLCLLTAPLAISAFILSSTHNIPNLIVENQWGTAELGLFGWFMTLTYGGLPVINALGQAIVPRLSRYYSEQKPRAFMKVLFKAVSIGLLLGTSATLFVYFCGEQLLQWYKPEYAERWPLLMLLMLTVPVQYGGRFFGSAVTAMQCFRFVMIMQITSLIVFLGSCYLLTNLWGIHGLALSLLAGGLFRVGLCCFWTFYKLQKLQGFQSRSQPSQENSFTTPAEAA